MIRTTPRAFVALALLPMMAAPLGVARAEEPRQVPQTRTDVLLSFAPVVKKAQPAVVNVYASRMEKRARNSLFDDPFFRQFFGEGVGPRAGGPSAQSLGSGVIVDPTGLIVTNHHVIDGMNQVKVALADKREFPATILVDDPKADLAVLKIKDDQPLPALELGDSDQAQVGDIVLALGNPFGVGQTVTQGIVSALARTTMAGNDYQSYIQTDAAINPGNSGGALVDMNARLIGVNAAIYSQTGSSIGIGFAIPVNSVKIVVQAAKRGNHEVKRPWFGASLQNVTHDLAESMNLGRMSGALVSDVLDNSPAAEAGIKRGDVITSFDAQPVDDPDAFGYRLSTHPLGATVPIKVQRGGSTVDLSLKLVSAPETPAREPVTVKSDTPFGGLTVVNLSPAVAEEMSLARSRNGVVITTVEDNSNAALTGFQKGDIIVSVNGEKVGTTKDLARMTGSADRLAWRLTLVRAGHVIDTEVGG